jgi:hypothetical protein
MAREAGLNRKRGADIAIENGASEKNWLSDTLLLVTTLHTLEKKHQTRENLKQKDPVLNRVCFLVGVARFELTTT